MEGFGNRQNRSDANTPAHADHGSEFFNVAGFAQGTYNIKDRLSDVVFFHLPGG